VSDRQRAEQSQQQRQGAAEPAHLLDLRHAAVAAVLACFSCHRVPATTPHPDALFRLRDRVIYRAVALDLRRRFIVQQHQALTDGANRTFPAALHDPFFLVNGRIVLASLFDDVLFNAISFFDYIGNLAGYVYLGPQGEKLKWKGWVESAHRNSQSPLIASGMATAILAENRRWVSRLQKVRGRVIHYGATLGNAAMTTKFGEKGFTVSLSFEVPDRVAVELPFLRELPKPLLMDRAATLVVEETLRTGTGILERIAKAPRIWQS
jgi:hypothetical protein